MNSWSIAYTAGRDDRRRRCRLGWFLLQLAPVSDRELSDYWEGWHAAGQNAANGNAAHGSAAHCVNGNGFVMVKEEGG